MRKGFTTPETDKDDRRNMKEDHGPAGFGSCTRRRGRPPSLCEAERRALILDAASRILASEGLQGTTMAAIAREAGMSKRTLYELFEDRDALFEACVRRTRLQLVRPLTEAERALPLAERLRILLRPGGCLTEQSKAILRAVIAEAPAHPELARGFLREGPYGARRSLREELDRAVAAGEVEIEDTDATARILCNMSFQSPVETLVDPDAVPPAPEAVEACLARIITIFLHGVARRAKG